MKKITYLATICGLILLGLSSCQKENLKGGQFTATIAQMNNDDKVTYDGTGFAWQNGDGITVYRGNSTHGLYRATLSDVNNSTRATFSFDPSVTSNNVDVTDNSYHGKFYAVYPTEIAPVPGTSMTNLGYVILPSSQILVADNQNNLMLVGFPMYAECSADSRQLKFKNICGLLKLHLEKANTTISSISISTQDGILNGRFHIVSTHNDNGELTAATLSGVEVTVTDAHKAIAVHLPAPQSIANGKDFYIALPAREYQTLTITITDNTGKVCTKSLNSTHTFHVGTSEWSSITLTNNDLVFEEVSVDVEGALSGVFSVGGNKTVVFSKGNLQYRACENATGDLTHTTSSTAVNASNGIWRFADNQYDMVETANGDLSSHYTDSYTGWIDHFRWGTSGHNGKYPYSSAPSISSDLVNSDYDWGVCNAISNGGNQPGLWRTLTSGEWQYLFNRYTNCWTRIAITIDNEVVNGIVLFPDTWTLPSGITLSKYGTNSKYENNGLTLSQWEQMHNAGAVFFPAVGQVSNSYSLAGLNSNARYWTATPANSGTTNAISFYFKNSTGTNAISFSQSYTRQNIYAVRLVHDVN